MKTYCIITMAGNKHFVNSENPIDRSSQLANNFIVINQGKTIINTKSITEITTITNMKEANFRSIGIEVDHKQFKHLEVKKTNEDIRK